MNRSRIIAGNVLILALLASSIGAFIVNQRDKAAARPANESKVTQYRLDYALKKAKAQRKILMVEFGADWCEDCIVLARNLADPVVNAYFDQHFNLLRVDVGPKGEKNLDVGESLGLDMSHGIPAAVFFAPDGAPIGATSHGELEPSRKFTARQILAFLTNVAEEKTIVSPDRFANR